MAVSAAAFLSDLLVIAEAAARAGGAVAKSAFGRRQSIETKADGSEVTQIDLAAQSAVIAVIHAQRPHDSIIGEEKIAAAQAVSAVAPQHQGGSTKSGQWQGQVYWVIDPIDGTRNYIRGLPLYACSVAACIEGWPVAGAIYAPQLEEMYSAREGAPLQVNGRPSRPADREGVAKTPVIAIPSNVIEPARRILLAGFDHMVLRSLGSTALHLAWVAAGAYEGAMNSDCKLWDIAAGFVLVRAAGGLCTKFNGGALFPMDLAAYHGEATPCIAARDETTLELLKAI